MKEFTGASQICYNSDWLLQVVNGFTTRSDNVLHIRIMLQSCNSGASRSTAIEGKVCGKL